MEERGVRFSRLCPQSGLHAGVVKLSPQTWQAVVREAAARAVGEDVGPDDVTSRLLISPDLKANRCSSGSGTVRIGRDGCCRGLFFGK